MRKTYEYMHVISALDSIDVEDISQCDIKALNDAGQVWYLHVSTSLGRTKTIEFGPIVDQSVSDDTFSYKKIVKEYKEKWVDNIISNFIDNPRRLITQVFIIEPDELYDQLDMIKEQLI